MPVFRLLYVFYIGLLLSLGAVKADGGITFHDIAANDGAGIAYRHVLSVIGNSMKHHGAPGVAILDYDNDGDQDLYATNGQGASNSLYRNQLVETGQLTFVDVADQAGVAAADQDSTGVCYGDLDNDGDPDLLVLGHRSANLRFVTPQQNLMNRRLFANSSAKVTW